MTAFYLVSFRFWPKFEKPLSQKNFSIKFGSKKENMNRTTKLHFKLFHYKMAVKTIFDIAQ